MKENVSLLKLTDTNAVVLDSKIECHMKRYIINLITNIFIIGCIKTACGQSNTDRKTWAIGISSGYQHQEISMLKLGIWALRDLNYANYLRVDGGIDFAFYNQKTYYIPEVSLSYYLSAKGIWPSIKAELTPYTLTPKVAIGIFNILEFGIGYGVHLQDKKELPKLDGINVSIGLSIPFNYYIK